MLEQHKKWIEKRGIDPVLAEKFGIDTTNAADAKWLTVPYVERGRVINHKYRLTSEKRHRMDPDAPLSLWNHDVLLRPEVQRGEVPVIITEGEWDALAAIQCGFPHVVSVPNGAPATTTDDPFEARRYEFLQRSRDLIDNVKTFILATDGDDPGRALAADLARLLGPERCRFVEYPPYCKDLNDVLLLDATTVVETINAAKAYPVQGLYRFHDFPEPPPVQSLTIGMEGVDDLFRLVPGTLSLITGYAGQGKTSWLLAALGKLLKQGVPMALASFETATKPILLRRMRSAIYECAEFDQQALRAGPADDLLAEKFGIICQTVDDEESEMTLEYLLDLAKVAVLRDGIRLLVIDPWNEIEHKRNSDESETDYTGRAIRALKRFARLYECAVWLVAHPRKPQADGKLRMPSLYDLAGSANFANKADYGVVIHRENPLSTVVKLRVAKVRMGLPGRMGDVELAWDAKRSAYDLCEDGVIAA